MNGDDDKEANVSMIGFCVVNRNVSRKVSNIKADELKSAMS